MTTTAQKQRVRQLDYARKRESQRLLWVAQQDKNFEEHISELMRYTMHTILNESRAWFIKYMESEGLTMTDVRKLAHETDIEALAVKAKQYVKNKDFGDVANAEMKLYNFVMKVSRHELLLRNIDIELISTFDAIEKLFQSNLEFMTIDEINRQAGLLGLHAPTTENMNTSVKRIVEGSFHNNTFSERIWEHQSELRKVIHTGLDKSLLMGKNPQTWQRELKKYTLPAFSKSTYVLRRLAVTETARVQIEAQMDSYKRSEYDSFMVVCEPTACDQCKPFDGRVAPVHNFQVGGNAPPFHPNCKCSTSAYMDRKNLDRLIAEFNAINGIK